MVARKSRVAQKMAREGRWYRIATYSFAEAEGSSSSAHLQTTTDHLAAKAEKKKQQWRDRSRRRRDERRKRKSDELVSLASCKPKTSSGDHCKVYGNLLSFLLSARNVVRANGGPPLATG